MHANLSRLRRTKTFSDHLHERKSPTSTRIPSRLDPIGCKKSGGGWVPWVVHENPQTRVKTCQHTNSTGLYLSTKFEICTNRPSIVLPRPSRRFIIPVETPRVLAVRVNSNKNVCFPTVGDNYPFFQAATAFTEQQLQHSRPSGAPAPSSIKSPPRFYGNRISVFKPRGEVQK